MLDHSACTACIKYGCFISHESKHLTQDEGFFVLLALPSAHLHNEMTKQWAIHFVRALKDEATLSICFSQNPVSFN